MLYGAEFVVGMYAVHIETIISDEILGQSGYNFVCIGYFTMFFSRF